MLPLFAQLSRHHALTVSFAAGRSFATSQATLAGHNKWSKIKHQKGANDAKKGAINSRAHRDIVVAVRIGSSTDPAVNTALATALRKAKTQGVPKQTIEGALRKATGDSAKGSQYMTFEIMASGGTTGIIVECLTDNINRTLHSLRDIASDCGARSAPVAFLFQRKGCVQVLLDRGDNFEPRLERLIDAALEAGAEDFEQLSVEEFENTVEVQFTCAPTSLAQVTTAVLAPGFSKELVSSELVYKPTEQSESPDEEALAGISKLVENLESDEDVLRVWTTLD